MTDISVGAGGAPFNSETDDRYLARLFAMRYTDNSRLSLYANANNVKREAESHAPRWLQGFSVATDIKMFSRRGYGDSSMNRDDIVWNLSLSRSFLNPFGKKSCCTCRTIGAKITWPHDSFSQALEIPLQSGDKILLDSG